MDPNACLERMIDAELDGDADAFAEATDDLGDWLVKGGFKPDWNRWDLKGLPKTMAAVEILRGYYGDA